MCDYCAGDTALPLEVDLDQADNNSAERLEEGQRIILQQILEMKEMVTKDRAVKKENQAYLKNEYTGYRGSNTLLIMQDNTEKDVGELSLDSIDNPERLWPMSDDPYIFLSHTGRDDVKEEIARPTYWFLTKVLRVKAFLDDLSLSPGEKVMEALLPHAYKCTSALVILSPTFREREFCVRELNTFMARWRRKDGIRVLPALWLMKNVDGYHPDVDGLIWIGNQGTKYCVKYMLQILWPKLVREFDRPEMSRTQLKEHLVEYVKLHRGGIHAIPPDLEDIANYE